MFLEIHFAGDLSSEILSETVKVSSLVGVEHIPPSHHPVPHGTVTLS